VDDRGGLGLADDLREEGVRRLRAQHPEPRPGLGDPAGLGLAQGDLQFQPALVVMERESVPDLGSETGGTPNRRVGAPPL
jgi:hypothetical protein